MNEMQKFMKDIVSCFHSSMLYNVAHWPTCFPIHMHYNDVIMSTITSQIPSIPMVYSTIYWGVDQRKHQSSASLAFVWGIHRWPVNYPHKGPVTRKMLPFGVVIMGCSKQVLAIFWWIINHGDLGYVCSSTIPISCSAYPRVEISLYMCVFDLLTDYSL